MAVVGATDVEAAAVGGVAAAGVLRAGAVVGVGRGTGTAVDAASLPPLPHPATRTTPEMTASLVRRRGGASSLLSPDQRRRGMTRRRAGYRQRMSISQVTRPVGSLLR